MVSTTAGGKPLKSAGCHMVPSPLERRSFLRGMRQGGAVTREISSGNQVRVGSCAKPSSRLADPGLVGDHLSWVR